MNILPHDPWMNLETLGEPFATRSYFAEGYVYRDLPKMSPEYFDKFIELVGEENIVWLTLADYGHSKRGQLLLSPEGQQKIMDRDNGQ